MLKKAGNGGIFTEKLMVRPNLFVRGSAEASVRFGSVFYLVRFGSAEPVKARFGRTLGCVAATKLRDFCKTQFRLKQMIFNTRNDKQMCII